MRSSGHIQAKGSMLKRSNLYFIALVCVILSNKAFCHAIVSTLGKRPGKVAAEKLNLTMKSSGIPSPGGACKHLKHPSSLAFQIPANQPVQHLGMRESISQVGTLQKADKAALA